MKLIALLLISFSLSAQASRPGPTKEECAPLVKENKRDPFTYYNTKVDYDFFPVGISPNSFNDIGMLARNLQDSLTDSVKSFSFTTTEGKPICDNLAWDHEQPFYDGEEGNSSTFTIALYRHCRTELFNTSFFYGNYEDKTIRPLSQKVLEAKKEIKSNKILRRLSDFLKSTAKKEFKRNKESTEELMIGRAFLLTEREKTKKLMTLMIENLSSPKVTSLEPKIYEILLFPKTENNDCEKLKICIPPKEDSATVRAYLIESSKGKIYPLASIRQYEKGNLILTNLNAIPTVSLFKIGPNFNQFFFSFRGSESYSRNRFYYFANEKIQFKGEFCEFFSPEYCKLDCMTEPDC